MVPPDIVRCSRCISSEWQEGKRELSASWSYSIHSSSLHRNVFPLVKVTGTGSHPRTTYYRSTEPEELKWCDWWFWCWCWCHWQPQLTLCCK